MTIHALGGLTTLLGHRPPIPVAVVTTSGTTSSWKTLNSATPARLLATSKDASFAPPMLFVVTTTISARDSYSTNRTVGPARSSTFEASSIVCSVTTRVATGTRSAWLKDDEYYEHSKVTETTSHVKHDYLPYCPPSKVPGHRP